MIPIPYIDRNTGHIAYEKVYGGKELKFLYGHSIFSRLLGTPLCHLISNPHWISALYGFWQKLPITKSKILPFIKEYEVDPSEFLEPVSSFQSFNDFFIRKLKPHARPIAKNPDVAVLPADARYWFFENIELATPFSVKGKPFNLEQLLGNAEEAKRYEQGSLVMARLCPSDYHRFHFPCDGIPSKPHLINGPLYSVNPIALKQNIKILSENKRMVTFIESEGFGKVAYIDVGATFVGSIHQTFKPHVYQEKGSEKGYFEFGGSSLILLFEKGKIRFSEDLLQASQKGLEIRCLMGQVMGHKAL